MCDTVIETARLYLRHFRNGDEYDLFEYLSEPEVNCFLQMKTDDLAQAQKAVEERIGTGFLSTPLILYVLTEISPGYAYRLLENEQMPGWLFMPKSGATTIWESWEGTQAQSGIASLDHYSKGAVFEWIYSTMCGINVGEEENSFLLKPIAGGDLHFARASYQSVYGEISCGWEHKEDKTIYSASVPANTSATLILPSGECTLTAGEYTFIE